MGPPVRVYYLQNQIDGNTNETYVNTKSVVDSVVIKNSKSYTSNNHDLTELKKGPIYVMSHIKIYNTAKNVSFDGMEFYFHENAKFDIIASNKVQFLGTTLMGTCGAMWQGVKLIPIDSGINVIFGKNSSNKKSLVRDAEIGLKSIYGKNKITIKDSTKFTANIYDVSISNGVLDKINIYGSLFIDTVKLNHRDKKSLVAINVENSKSRIGNNNFQKNYIVGHDAGIKFLNCSEVYLENCRIKNCDFGVQVINSVKLKVKNNEIDFCGIGMDINTISSLDFTNNIVSNSTSRYGNLSGGVQLKTVICEKIKIGGLKSEKNIFSGNKDYSIYIVKDNKIPPSLYFSNNNPTNEILPFRPIVNPLNWKYVEISNNEIYGALYHTGIHLLGLQKVKIDTCLIKYNRIESGLDMRIENVTMNNCSNYLIPTKNNVFDCYGNKNIFNNSFVVKSNVNYNLNNSFGIGILLDNCSDIIIHGNNFVGTSFLHKNAGIQLKNSQSCLVYKDTLRDFVNGVRVVGNCLYSNIYCNVFMNNLFGITLIKTSLRNRYTPFSLAFLPYDKKVHGAIAGSFFESRDNNFVSIAKGGSCINNDLIGDIYSNRWDFSDLTSRKINFVSSKILRGFVLHDNAINYCGSNNNNGSTSNLDSVISAGVNQDEIDSFWMNYYIADKALRGEIVVNNATAFCNQVVELESSMKSNTLSDMQMKWNSLIVNSQNENELKFVFGKMIDYLSNYDTLFNRSSRTDNFKNWINDSVFTSVNLKVDTSLFVVQHKMLHDSVLQQLHVIALKDPYNVSYAAFFARSFLNTLGKNFEYFDSVAPHYLSLVGQVTSSCTGGGTSGIVVKLMRQNGTYTGLTTVTEDFGYFQFDGISMKDLNHQDNYYVKAYFPNDTLHTTLVSSLDNLINDSIVIIDCLFPTPPQLGTRFGQSSKSGVRISPNPVLDVIHIENTADCDEVELVNSLGQVVKRISNSDKNESLELVVKDEQTGVYFLKFYYSNSTIASHKIIISK